MGLLKVSPELNEDKEIMNLMFKWLTSECDAVISDPIDHYPFSIDYLINGEDIPSGKKQFWLEVVHVVDGVMMLTICK